ncbi:MAG: 4-hydroxy-3-methylbut-2-enyl diphosphate reductase [Candidatus Krumholzibacteriota bacterium]|nr:4-hydroxy-3-methylbut-2-enyl diphosphate reductase [Candidatus Krumholzibacteriota bacterium]
MTRKIKIITSPHTGYCFGVKRAMRLIEERLESCRLYSTGAVIHNPQAVERLQSRGVIPVSSIEEMKCGDTLIIRAHGVDPEMIEKCERMGIELIDTTCPFVKRIHDYVEEMSADSREIIILGDARHPEVKGIAGRAREKALILDSIESARIIEGIDKAGVVIQTTFPREKSRMIIEELEKRIGDLQVHDTICEATTMRRQATLSLAEEVDMILVVGGKESSNTRRLYQMCLDMDIPARFIETASEIEDSWFEGCDEVGLTTGTSTPGWVIEEVLTRLSEIQ